MSQPPNRRRGRRTSRTAKPLDIPPQADPQSERPAAEAASAATALPAGVVVGDQVARVAQQAALAAGDVVPDPFAPAPLDPDTVTGTPEEQLATVTAAMRRAKATASTSAKAARARLTIELGAALDIAVDRSLYKAGGYPSVEAYAEAEIDLNRQYIYELIADSRRMREVMAAGLSEFSDSPPLASHAKVLAPLVAQDDGPVKAQKVLTAAKESGKVTAASLKAAAARLGYAAADLSAHAQRQEPFDNELAAKANAKLAAAADAAERALALYDEFLVLDALPADQARADTDLARLSKAARTLARHARDRRA
ncbi:hypothetical protein ACFXHD_23135 [Streptomyces hydrogenans]|uniref:hypothetical protein n=1 Tax=Streptomyces hydrogenans TaxID=1873719 RepID=UPI0036C126E2